MFLSEIYRRGIPAEPELALSGCPETVLGAFYVEQLALMLGKKSVKKCVAKKMILLD